MTKKQIKITKRQEILSNMIPNAISCEYISSVDKNLPNGLQVNTISINHDGFAYNMLAYKSGEHKRLKTNNSVTIQGVQVYYISL